MSSDDSDFDKEAEREKLRKKYGDDEKDRENTRRMSELLLQGATMTGKHCNACGDPIFRYDGQEFCPTCQTENDGAGESVATESGNAAEGAATSDERVAESVDARRPTSAESSDDAPDEAGESDPSDDEPRVEINDVRVAGQRSDRSDQRADDHRHADNHQHADRSGPHRRPPSQQKDDGVRRGRRRARTGDRGTDTASHSDGNLGEARAALVRKVTDLARRADETEDVSRSRDLLAATREAAEALAALDRANR